jgi:6-phosphofructokinase 1
MRRIAILTSGGDAPGMNAAIRAVARAGLARGWKMVGVHNGYEGLIKGEMSPLKVRDVGGIIQRGGTVLGSARCAEFLTEEGRRQAIDNLNEHGVSGVVVIGGNGSQAGAHALSQMGVPVVGVASTIDNDLLGSEITIGVDTALNIALEAIDRLKTTATSHRRGVLVEVMGRKCGYIALMTAIAGGAEAVVIPEIERSPEQVVDEMRLAYDRGKPHAVVVVAEGARYAAAALTEYFRANRVRIGFDVRTTVLGHVQRGGIPTAFDRLLATRLGAGAIDAFARDESGVLVGWNKSCVTTMPLADVVGKQKPIDPELFKLAEILGQ